jgi:predicted HD phosphohydrolase
MRNDILNNMTLVLAAFLHDIGEIRERSGPHFRFYSDEEVCQGLNLKYFFGEQI